MSDSITITDVGPIKRLPITVPPGGGVIILRGRNGTGKTTALRSVETLMRGSGKLETRDQAKVGGRVDGFGALLVLGHRTTRAGEVEVSSLEGRLNIADLVDPPLKTPEAADRQRIKALVSLTGVEPHIEAFAAVIGEDMTDGIDANGWAGRDLVDVAGDVKRHLETQARLAETEASTRDGQAKACEESARDIDVSAPSDEAGLNAAMLEASGNLRALQERQAAAERSGRTIAAARQRLDRAKAGYVGRTVAEAEAANAAAVEALTAARDQVVELQRQLDAAQAVVHQRKIEQSAAMEAVNAAREHADAIAECESIISSTATAPVDHVELEAAHGAAREASAAVSRGAIIRQAIAQKRQAGVYRQQAVDAAERAERLRIAAGQVDDVLSNAIECPALFVREGRLWTDRYKRGVSGDEPTLYNDLSQGQRWTLAFEVVAPIVNRGTAEGELGILVADEAWEHMDPQARAHVAGLAKEHHVGLLVTEPTDGELRAEAFDAEGGEA